MTNFGLMSTGSETLGCKICRISLILEELLAARQGFCYIRLSMYIFAKNSFDYFYSSGSVSCVLFKFFGFGSIISNLRSFL